VNSVIIRLPLVGRWASRRD